ncbi:DNA repair protein [Roseobacter sp. HKCCD9010]|uniref:DNA repair protein n=3 Tax=unclassified Roseobacter TaxID=196798 RepID=UPI0014911110|nr:MULTISPECIES: DNA repair protein [unclassified Roseobacter]MBF9049993.1 DNA repair protein [Rhodobacterales bacterium HKCCD4356]NNV38416.1 DNA repair protein [Roseobacter sp. HKCCD9054]NNV46629.1 DNA repair protein [Roseobacter sp. HKCCD6265]NNV76544.1 DNA repair protein [Roseobacter sp. HKCCD6135]NNV85394.1 DNA repair protein [Roseobacter sp. HKCCD8414]NNW06657.1 DNA repair protein [Roseobacter sp. HKCCD8431]NNW32157.1 DNA repair protein [Roseobacter sp. HKCCD8198]NNW49348.1 DNA repair 
MFDWMGRFLVSMTSILQRLAMVIVVVAAAVLLAAALAAAFGVLPWLDLPLSFGATTLPDGGRYLQIGVTGLLILLSLYLPANARMIRLETSHRDFRVRMEDVARAYAACHKADREGFFGLDREFDAVRERYAFLQEHPELETLEPQILELAAQMSLESRQLAQSFSVEKIERARRFLQQRQHEIDGFEAHLDRARAACAELTVLAEQVEDEEIRLGEKRRAVEHQLRAALTELGFELRHRPADEPRVITMHTASSPAE